MSLPATAATAGAGAGAVAGAGASTAAGAAPPNSFLTQPKKLLPACAAGGVATQVGATGALLAAAAAADAAGAAVGSTAATATGAAATGSGLGGATGAGWSGSTPLITGSCLGLAFSRRLIETSSSGASIMV